MLSGLAYYRIERDMSRKKLAERVGTTTKTVALYEKLAWEGKGRSSLWMAFSDCLGVPVQELLKTEFQDVVDRNNGRKLRESRTANSSNPITNYYRIHRLSYQELAERLGKTSREFARLVCASENPQAKYIKALAEHEGISEKAFIRKYSANVSNSKKEHCQHA